MSFDLAVPAGWGSSARKSGVEKLAPSLDLPQNPVNTYLFDGDLSRYQIEILEGQNRTIVIAESLARVYGRDSNH